VCSSDLITYAIHIHKMNCIIFNVMWRCVVMEKYIINGGNNLKGELDIKGAKNAILPILAATVISGETSVISNVSMLRDVEVMIEILTSLGAKVDLEGDSLIVDSSTINSISLSEELVRK